MREMKDSGIAWIGNIPESWNIIRGKNVLINLSRKVTSTDDVVTCFRDGEVTLRKNRREEGFTFSEKEIGYQGIEPGDLVIHGMDGFAGAIGISDSRGKGSPVLNVCDSKENKLFLTYYLRNLAYRDIFVALSTGIRVRSCDLRWNKVAALPFIVPPREDQDKIVDYLDTQCSKIDTLIANQQSQIEKLKSYKQSLITEVVTKGLDKNVPMKDSGVEWIGDIPCNWQISKVRYIGTLQNGLSKGGEYFGEGHPFVSYGDIYKNYELPENVSGLVKTDEKERENYSVKQGDIFFTRTSETIEEVGFSCVCKKTIENATFAGFVIRLRPYKKDDIILTEFAKYYFRGTQIRAYLIKEMNLVTRASLGQTLLKSMSVTVPPLDEQKRISEYLDTKCLQIDNLISIKEQKIEKLHQYKKSLIYEYVTGKKEVK